MNPRRPALALASSAMLLPLIACGVSNTPTLTTSPSPAANLAGNWLLAGSLPVTAGGFGGSSPASGMVATFDVVGTEVSGIVNYQTGCNSQGFPTPSMFPAVVAGTVAADGSFTLSTPATPNGLVQVLALTIQGKLPASAGGAWSGTSNYTLSSAVGPCTSLPSTGSIPIAATSIPLLNGTYTGTTSGALLPPSPSLSISTTLRQSASVTTSAGTTYLSDILLSGSISVAGSSCLTSGTPYNRGSSIASPLPVPVYSGYVEGNTVNAMYQMNDNSIISLFGSISKTDASQIIGSLITVQAGTCNTNLFSTPVTLTKQ